MSKSPVSLESYQDYLALKKVGDLASDTQKLQEMFSSEIMQEREKENLIYLKGFECAKCGVLYFIKTKRCPKCKGENFHRKGLSKTGVVFTYTKEYYFPSSFPPVAMLVVDLNGGGRITLQLTDDMHLQKDDGVQIGSKVELVLRKMMENDARPNYFWKCKLL